MRLAHQFSIAVGLIAVAVSAVGIMPAQAHDGWKHRHKHHHYYYAPPGHVRYYSAPPVIYERPIVYREAPMYYGPPVPSSLNFIIPLR